MNKDNKREPEYPTDLESQFILRLPDEPSKVLKQLLENSENLKNRLTISVDNDMRHGEVRFDHWLMHAKIVDLPTVVESLKTIDNKSFYKTADICQMMICKNEPDQTTDEEVPTKNKKKDPYKVDKKFLWPHGVTPPTKNVRKRRFRKTLKKKCAEAPEIEKEVKRLLRADNEAVSVTWEVIKEEEDTPKQEVKMPPPKVKPEKKPKSARAAKKDSKKVPTEPVPVKPATNLVDIFGGALSDSDAEDDNVNIESDTSRKSTKNSKLFHNKMMLDLGQGYSSKYNNPFGIDFHSSRHSENPYSLSTATSTITSKDVMERYSEEELDNSRDNYKDDMSGRIEQLRIEVEELKQRRQRTQLEITKMENLALKQRFQDNLHTLNQDIMYKEMEYQGLITLQTSEDI